MALYYLYKPFVVLLRKERKEIALKLLRHWILKIVDKLENIFWCQKGTLLCQP